ncbi:MAG: hypothetical protein A2W35_06805 [Chloroflexi bacterium RBG_16_57_11]|nr:MAG: hypothetical protein A2W35_06805 [Chloroflexi bacterium RBG_16_57_11]
MSPKLDVEALAEQLKPLNGLTEKLVASKGQATFTRKEVKSGKLAAMAVLSSITPLNQAGNPINPIDARIATQLRANSDTAKQAIRTIASQKIPSPLDYYDIYHQMLEDSGIMVNGLPDPLQMGELVEKVMAKDKISPFDPMIEKAICSGCSHCLACEGCGVCIYCIPAAVIALGAASTAAGTLGAIGSFF